MSPVPEDAEEIGPVGSGWYWHRLGGRGGREWYTDPQGRTWTPEEFDRGERESDRAKRGPLTQPSVAAAEHRPSGAEWIAIVRAYRRAQGGPDKPLPSQDAVAREWGNRSADTLARHLRRLGVADWHGVHALVASEP